MTKRTAQTQNLLSIADNDDELSCLLELLNNSGNPFLVIDGEQNIRYANPAAEQALGLERSRLNTLAPSLTDNPNDHFEWSWQSDSGVTRFKAARSTTRWNGEPMSLLTLHDVSKWKNTEDRLRLLERSLAATYNGVIIVDAEQDDWPIIYVNPAFERITGYSSDEALGRNCRFLQGQDTDQPAVQELKEALVEQKELNVVVKNHRKDGIAFWNDLYIAPVSDRDGNVTHFIGIQHDISAQRHYEDTLAYISSHDVLTGLPNRALLADRLLQSFHIARRYQRAIAVMYIDLDGFKPVNDLLGYPGGDQVLMEVATRLEDVIRPGDTLARLSADEFAILLPDLAFIDDVLHIAEHVLIEVARPFTYENSHYQLTASIGIASSEEYEDDPVSLVQQSDRAMHQAKLDGGNAYRLYTEELNQSVAYKLHLRSEIQKALETEAFELHYQPLLSLSDGQLSGVEALIRWRHPELGLIAPGDFIPMSENTGQILTISDWVLEAACQARLRLNQAGYPLTIAVNLSPTLFRDRHMAERMINQVHKHGLSCRDFELEILESVVVGQYDQTLNSLNALRHAGFRLAIDDFGTGFSSLSYLKSLPIQTIKIDRSFIQEIIHDQADAAIVRATMSMAHHLDLKVVAEGVETEAQSAFLKRERCDEIQGFLHSPALPLDQLLTFIENKRRTDQKAAPETRFEGRCLLIVDDDPFILKSLSRALRGEGYQTLLANSAADAFVMLAQMDIQVILSDQRMPEMNGTEFFRRVKSLYPDTVRIVLSGYTDLNTVTEAINQGAIYKFLTKPWDDDELRSVISDAFNSVYQRKGEFGD